MSTPTVSDFHAMFDVGEPAFAVLSDASIAAQISYAVGWSDAQVWGTHFTEGVLLLAAHELALQAWQAAKGGGVAVAREFESKSVGGVSVSRGQGIAREAENYYARTTYGQKWQQLARRVGKGPILCGYGT